MITVTNITVTFSTNMTYILLDTILAVCDYSYK